MFCGDTPLACPFAATLGHAGARCVAAQDFGTEAFLKHCMKTDFTAIAAGRLSKPNPKASPKDDNGNGANSRILDNHGQ